MKEVLLITFLCLNLTFNTEAQTVKVFYENKSQGFILYVTNYELYPVSISLDLDLSNMNFSEGNRNIFVIPPKSVKFKIGELSTVSPRIGTRFSYTYKSTMGDVTLKKYDKSFVYDLPFPKGKGYTVYQGYNGTFSHQNENALDFTMPEGTEVSAVRDGIVIKIVQNNTESCPREECKIFNNYIIVMHADGTFAYYAHIKFNGAKCTLGDSVKKGDIIAYSGNVGWSSAPHLHFSCFLGGF